MESSPRFRSTNSENNNSTYNPCNNFNGKTKLRLMCSNGGHIVPRPHDKSLCYVGGETRMVAVDRHITLLDLTRRLSKTLFRSSSLSNSTSPPPPTPTPASAPSFTLKYQLPSEDLDSLISVTTDEDLENMIDEFERINERLNSSSRIRLFVFPTNPESVSSIGSFLENPVKSEDWFLNALNGTNSGFSDTSSVNNCLLDLDDEICDKKDVTHKTDSFQPIGATNLITGNNSGQDIHSIPDSPWMETTTSSFGSASSTPSIGNLAPIKMNGEDYSKNIVGGGGIEEEVFQIGVEKRRRKDQDGGGLMASPAPVVVSGSPTGIDGQSDPFLSYQERSEQGLQMNYVKHHQDHQQQTIVSTGLLIQF
ncbi:hypothetical protein SSX86_017587 [Deinandra increscens subsp. villosa]|uniref:PB1 domain-containing protein n=1 Tax=Deinandra increscens subsp. villosa TaxID=3103831 RepID=A0AAP0CVG6_9ASTR